MRFRAFAAGKEGHFAHYLHGLHLKGIGGPGAPHVFRLERVADAGALKTCDLNWNLTLNLNLLCNLSKSKTMLLASGGRTGSQVSNFQILATTTCGGRAQ